MEQHENKLILFEDEYLLLIHKPAGINTHSPDTYGGEGIYEWLRGREPRWKNLAIMHRLDKETSGVLLFTKTKEANRSLAMQFESQRISKVYTFLTDRITERRDFAIISALKRFGTTYRSHASGKNSQQAETHFKFLTEDQKLFLWQAQIISGRTHQIRVHASENGIAILGDILYGGSAYPRMLLHAREIRFRHPITNESMLIGCPADFDQKKELAMRALLLSLEAPPQTNYYRLLHGAADGHANLYVDQVGDFLLATSPIEASKKDMNLLRAFADSQQNDGIYEKKQKKELRGANQKDTSPELAWGKKAPESFETKENGVRYEMSFERGASIGLFADQIDNRRRILTNYIDDGFAFIPDTEAQVLNTFAYTCGFSVCAALAGAHTTNIDLSRKYLEWGERNFRLNGLNPDSHEFLAGDVFDWLKRLLKKNRQFNAIILDPPTFSSSKKSGVFRVEKDYAKLLKLALPLLSSEGTLLACANMKTLAPEAFLKTLRQTVEASGFIVDAEHYCPQPPFFPVSREEPAYLKTVWLKLQRK